MCLLIFIAMLELVLHEREAYDETNNRFYIVPEKTVHFALTLKNVAKWEAKIKKSFFNTVEKITPYELEYLMQCCCLEQLSSGDIRYLNKTDYAAFTEYMGDSHTATIINEKKSDINTEHYGKQKQDVLTTEYIYYFIFKAGIDSSVEDWNIHRLLTLLKIFAVKTVEENNAKAKIPKGRMPKRR